MNLAWSNIIKKQILNLAMSKTVIQLSFKLHILLDLKKYIKLLKAKFKLQILVGLKL